MMLRSTFLCILACATIVLGAEKQIKLEDIERDNLNAKQARTQQQQQQQLPQKQQQQPQQQQAKPEQPPSAPEYTAPADVSSHQANLQHQQILFQHLQAYQPQVQFQAPPTAGAVALYPATFLAGNGLGGNHLGIPTDVSGIHAVPAAYIQPQQQNTPSAAFPQQIYLHQGGYAGLQFVPAAPTPLIYTNPQELPKAEQTPGQVPQQAPVAKEVPAATAPQPPTHNPQAAVQQPQQAPAQLPPSPPPNADSNFAYNPQQNYNPIPKELQSYTTIPDAVYQGKEPDYIYDQQPTISLTNEQFNPYNALYQQPLPQRPVFSSGVKSAGPTSLKSFPSGGNIFARNSFLSPTRHFPGPGISYSSYRQGPGAF
ncbi:AP2-associated protein kinase 1-like [Periplaneta americana]|uniref:AP2-associated protein kinase 1-like n=1 Tax=Periplaneta americana TaxID=6978 RepID=UPI0037E8EDFF